MNGSSLPARHREMLMLRMGWLCQSEYEWAQHARIATSDAGLADQEIHRIAEGPKAAGWTDFRPTSTPFSSAEAAICRPVTRVIVASPRFRSYTGLNV